MSDHIATNIQFPGIKVDLVAGSLAFISIEEGGKQKAYDWLGSRDRDNDTFSLKLVRNIIPLTMRNARTHQLAELSLKSEEYFKCLRSEFPDAVLIEK